MEKQYLTRDSSLSAIRNINSLFGEIKQLYYSHGIDITGDVGRQNILISAAQEHFFADAINSSFGDCSNDGRTGAADIIIECLDDRELECKVVCQGKTGSWNLQTDKATLQKKGKCDFLYLLFDRTHTNVGLFLFPELTADDFKDPSPGSRGKARLDKGLAFKKCIPLVGSFEDKRKNYMRRYEQEMGAATDEKTKQIAAQKLEMWYNKSSQYKIQLEALDDIC
jgi:hypothetical protein